MRKVVMALMLVIVFSCSNKKVPENVLPQAKMEKVMMSLMRADEWAAYRHMQDTSFKIYDSSVHWYQQVFKDQKTDETTFQRSMKFYEEHPDLLQTIIDSLQRHVQTSAMAPATTKPPSVIMTKGIVKPIKDTN